MKHFTLGILLAAAFYFYRPDVGCHDARQVMRHYLAFRHLGVLSTAISNSGNVYMWFRNDRTGEWSVIRITDDNQACFLTEGTDYRFILESFL